jgi:hypothetical protein
MEEEKKEMLALVDQDGAARVYPVDRTQLEAAFAAVGGGSPIDGTGRKRIIFYPVAGTDQGIDEEISSGNTMVTDLSEVLGLLQLAASREASLGQRHEYWKAISDVNDIIRHIVEEMDVLINAIKHSQREARQSGRADIQI